MPIVKRTRSAQVPLVAEFLFSFNDGMAPLSALNGASVEDNPRANVTDFGSRLLPTGVLSGVTYVAGSNAVTTGDKFFEMIRLPLGAQVIGGDLQVEVAFAGPTTTTLALGDAVLGTEYLAATSLAALGRTALTIPADAATNAFAGQDVRGSMLFTGGQAATAGRARVRIMYTIDGRGTEVA